MPGKRRSLVNKKKIICPQCKLEVLDKEDAIECDVCEKTLHSLCTKLDKRDYDKFTQDTTLEYKCHMCNGGSDNSSISSDILEIKTKLKGLDQLSQLSGIKETIDFMSAQYDTILNGIVENKKKIDGLQRENAVLKEEVRSLKSSVKFLNDDRVKNDCVINGIVVAENKSAVDVVLDIADKVGATISEEQIVDAYFLQNKKKMEKKSVVVKFASKKQKDCLMAGKPKLKECESLKTVFVNDFLSRESMQLLNYAKTVKSVGYKFVFVKAGKVFVRKNEHSHVLLIRSMDDIDKIILRSTQGNIATTSRRSRSNQTIQTVLDDEEEEEENGSFLSPN